MPATDRCSLPADPVRDDPAALLRAIADQLGGALQRRVGADLHDGLGQDLTGIALLLRGLHSDVIDGRAASAAQIDAVIALVNRSIETTREMARDLAPVGAEQGGLAGALRRLAASSSRPDGAQVVLRLRLPSSVTFSHEESTQLLRIAQEAVANALRHGAPRRVQITLSHDAGYACLRISDDGRGFPDRHVSHGGLGLQVMRFRASMLCGELQIERRKASSRRAAETAVVCRVPVQ